MTRSEIHDYAEKHGHKIIYTKLEEFHAISTEIEDNCYIGISDSIPESKETELIAHELGHCEYAGFYSRYTPMETRERIEYRARKWQYMHLIPLGKLREALKNGITTPWDLAEYFDVSEQLIRDACDYYTNACASIMGEDAV